MDNSNRSQPWFLGNINLSAFEKLFHVSSIETTLNWVIFAVELPAICLAVYGLYFLISSDRATPVFVINLLISDLIQICVKPALHSHPRNYIEVFLHILYTICVTSSIGFMLCISLERYMMITHPIWYRYHHSIKYSVLISLFIWIFGVVLVGMDHLIYLFGNMETAQVMILLTLLIPYPLIVFSYVRTKKALSSSVSIPQLERKRILRILALVLFNYTVLFLPCKVFIVLLSTLPNTGKQTFLNPIRVLINTLMSLNPLVDCLLYVFMRRDAKGMLSFCSCCERSRQEQDLAQVPPTSVVQSGDIESTI